MTGQIFGAISERDMKMSNYMFPAQAERDEKGNVCEWVRDMLDKWEDLRKPYLCFPFARDLCTSMYPSVFVRNEENSRNRSFWLYMYYRKPHTGKDYVMGGQIRFRIHVCAWHYDDYKPPCNTIVYKYNSSNVYFIEGYPGMETTIRFICDGFEEICLPNGNPLCIEKFGHPESKSLPSVMESVGITPAEHTEEIRVIRSYFPGG